MSKCLDHLTNSIDVFQDTIDATTQHSNASKNEEEAWKNTVYTTVCIPKIDHINVASNITKNQEKRDEMALCCPGGQTMRSKILWQVEESLAGIRAVEKEILANNHAAKRSSKSFAKTSKNPEKGTKRRITSAV